MAHVTTSVCAKSGELTKSYSSLGSLVRSFFSVTFVSCPAGCFEKTVFTPSKENMCRTTESPCLEFSLNPSSSMVASGSIISAGTVRNSVLSNNVIVEEGATVEGSVLMPGVRIGKGAVVRHAILDKNVVVSEGEFIGVDHDRDAARFTISPGGVVCVGKNEVV